MIRIIRGTIIGILLGVIGGVAISYLGSVGRKIAPQQKVGRAVEEVLTTGESGDPAADEVVRLQDKFLRLHVKANSDSDEDIALKYMVRDAVLAVCQASLEGADSKEEAVEEISLNKEEIEAAARKCICDCGYDYDVKASVVSKEFPIRFYGGMILPAGTYDALYIEIGEAKGENFWCMLYPTVCFTSDAAAVVSEEDCEALKRALTEEEYEQIFVDTTAREKGEIRLDLKIFDLF